MKNILYTTAIIGALFGGLSQANANFAQTAHFYIGPNMAINGPIPLHMIDRAAVADRHNWENVHPGCDRISCLY